MEPIQNDALSYALLAAQRRAFEANRLAPRHFAPAYWAHPVRGEVEVRHVHLLDGTPVAFSATITEKDERVDVAFGCPTLFEVLLAARQQGNILLVCLN